MKSSKISLRLSTSLVLIAAFAPLPAFAQSDPANDLALSEQAAPGEIVVTATKRSESLQAVPISVTAIGGDELAKSRITTVDALVTKVANLQLSATVGDNAPIFALRGVSMSDYSLNQSSPVATYYDEVYKGNFAFLGVAMYDLDRIEVLRGPQGTLYGKNTTGGAVNLIARTAQLGEFNGYVNAGYGNYDRIDLNGAVNVPLGDRAALRLAGTFTRADGWFDNVLPGFADLNETREYGLRGTVRFEPTDSLRFVLRASTSYQNPHNYGIYAQPEATLRPGLKTREIESDVSDRRRARTYAVALNADIDVSDALTLTSITSYDEGSLFFKEDTDGQPIDLLEISYGDRAKQFTQDLRLTSSTSGPFDFILGAYFAKEDVFNSNNIESALLFDVDEDGDVDAEDCALGIPAACQLRNRFDQSKKSVALYSDFTYRMTDNFALRGGLRYTHDTGKQTGLVAGAYSAQDELVYELIPDTTRSFKKDNLSGKIGADYKFDNGNLAYASISRGYRAPSFNAQALFSLDEATIAKAEKVTAYEIGLKTRLADRRVTFNSAAFYYDYRNQQFINIDPVTGFQSLLNIAKSRIYGAEFELGVFASDALSFRAGLGLLSTKIKEGLVSGVNVAGNRLSNAPRLTFNAGVDLILSDSAAGKFSVHPDISYQSSQFFEVLNVPRLEQGSYALLGGRMDYETADGLWTASVWGRNLTNKTYFTSRLDLLGSYGFDYNHLGNPRTYGITVGRKF
ncbi:TonB-dependent receptor [Novosphingobium tardum]|uniref:TonB-dependent receptor n=1 Tax=Novosphingobium tardum TaxID=1538021 RepID=A0ABV8RMR6_9SPHN